ncbi:hypothetical protein [Plebeiibacterium marinum]|uniref:Uncharacterized protein n=1 Tax=Plebeiibacterium marinum TaxID=2992111 RepID=A0AAE3MHQ7_9BACT|nr:hypothetical protein [Plebeiobacterium marinum]MCW3808063.1 hypothetical protein [Plebeiobacterium marinum]
MANIGSWVEVRFAILYAPCKLKMANVTGRGRFLWLHWTMVIDNGYWLEFKKRNNFKNEIRTNTARVWVKGLVATFEVLGVNGHHLRECTPNTEGQQLGCYGVHE